MRHQGLLDDLYLRWLYRQIATDRFRNPAKTYWRLIRQLYTKEFYWFVPNDDNRVMDGIELRYEFAREEGIDLDTEWLELECSVLEMLIALSKRLSFEADGETRAWFWHLLSNLGISHYTDLEYNRVKTRNGEIQAEQDIDEVLENLIWRTYEPDGRGGLFPIENPKQDQTTIEIWYQVAAYLLQ